MPVWTLVDLAVLAFIERLPDDERRDLARASKRMSESAE